MHTQDTQTHTLTSASMGLQVATAAVRRTLAGPSMSRSAERYSAYRVASWMVLAGTPTYHRVHARDAV